MLLSSLNTETPHLIEILPDMLGRHPREVNAPPFAPGEELRYGSAGKHGGVSIANLAIEKLFSGEDGCRTLTGDDRRKRAFSNSKSIF